MTCWIAQTFTQGYDFVLVVSLASRERQVIDRLGEQKWVRQDVLFRARGIRFDLPGMAFIAEPWVKVPLPELGEGLSLSMPAVDIPVIFSRKHADGSRDHSWFRGCSRTLALWEPERSIIAKAVLAQVEAADRAYNAWYTEYRKAHGYSA